MPTIVTTTPRTTNIYQSRRHWIQITTCALSRPQSTNEHRHHQTTDQCCLQQGALRMHVPILTDLGTISHAARWYHCRRAKRCRSLNLLSLSIVSHPAPGAGLALRWWVVVINDTQLVCTIPHLFGAVKLCVTQLQTVSEMMRTTRLMWLSHPKNLSCVNRNETITTTQLINECVRLRIL